MKVNFYDKIEDIKLRFAIIISKYNGKYVLCKHKERDTFEIPGGHRELEESILQTAKRELYEETGATVYDIEEVCVYSVLGKDGRVEEYKESFGMLYFAEIYEFDKKLDSEIERIELFDNFPKDNLTYPLINIALIEKFEKNIKK